MNSGNSAQTEHAISLNNRKELKITGVNHIISFDDSFVSLSTVSGNLEVDGSELNIDALDLDHKYVLIRGELTGINYTTDQSRKKKSFWRKE